MIDLNPLLDSLDLVLARAARLVGDEAIADLRSAAQTLRRRSPYLAEMLVLALAGGTGSGKSSVLNAIAGDMVSSTSALRPHTDQPLAWIPARRDAALDTLLDEAGIKERTEQERFEQLAVIDLPDHDSVVGTHRQMVGRLLPKVDVIGWVVDPEKYRDRVLIEEYLKPLVDYEDQFLFVLNQIDRIEGFVEHVASDLRRALEAIGYRDPAIFTVAADPPGRDPMGIDELVAFLEQRLDAKRVIIRRTLTDIGRLARNAEERTNLQRAHGLDFDARWDDVAASVARGRAADFEDRLCKLEDFVAAVAVETGGPFGAKIRERYNSPLLEDVLTGAIEGDGDTRSRLDYAIGEPLRASLWERAELAATIAALAVEVAQAEARWRKEEVAVDA